MIPSGHFQIRYFSDCATYFEVQKYRFQGWLVAGGVLELDYGHPDGPRMETSCTKIPDPVQNEYPSSMVLEIDCNPAHLCLSRIVLAMLKPRGVVRTLLHQISLQWNSNVKIRAKSTIRKCKFDPRKSSFHHLSRAWDVHDLSPPKLNCVDYREVDFLCVIRSKRSAKVLSHDVR
jgi:hypothetical protein